MKYPQQSSLFDTNKMTQHVYDLPDASLVFFENFFSKEESDRLFKNLLGKINWKQDQIRMFGKLIDQPRLTALYGDPDLNYTYSGLTMNPLPWNKDLLFIKSRIEEES